MLILVPISPLTLRLKLVMSFFLLVVFLFDQLYTWAWYPPSGFSSACLSDILGWVSRVFKEL